jgi:hypothetical protein
VKQVGCDTILLPLRHIGCLKIREFQIRTVVGDHFSSPNMEIKKILDSPTKIHWSEGALFEVRFLQIQVEKFSVYCYLWCRCLWKIINVKQFFEE